MVVTTEVYVFTWLWLVTGADLLWENSTADWLIAGGWCWFSMREQYCWLVGWQAKQTQRLIFLFEKVWSKAQSQKGQQFQSAQPNKTAEPWSKAETRTAQLLETAKNITARVVIQSFFFRCAAHARCCFNIRQVSQPFLHLAHRTMRLERNILSSQAKRHHAWSDISVRMENLKRSPNTPA